jgi:hypothetical protein
MYIGCKPFQLFQYYINCSSLHCNDNKSCIPLFKHLHSITTATCLILGQEWHLPSTLQQSHCDAMLFDHNINRVICLSHILGLTTTSRSLKCVMHKSAIIWHTPDLPYDLSWEGLQKTKKTRIYIQTRFFALLGSATFLIRQRISYIYKFLSSLFSVAPPMYHITHHMTYHMTHCMTCMWHITWLITWLWS